MDGVKIILQESSTEEERELLSAALSIVAIQKFNIKQGVCLKHIHLSAFHYAWKCYAAYNVNLIPKSLQFDFEENKPTVVSVLCKKRFFFVQSLFWIYGLLAK